MWKSIHPRLRTLLRFSTRRREHSSQDCLDDWQDLDDLLEAALDGESPTSTKHTSSPAAGGAQVAAGSQGSPEDEALIDGKLSELDALLKSEAQAAGGGNQASATTRFEQAGVEANKVMEAFLGGRGQGEEGEESDSSTRRDHLGHEEERLLEMMTEHVRLEGHGLIARASTPVQEKSGDLWLPLAPTAPPVARPGPNNPRNIAASSDSNNNPSRGEAARLLGQQAMDEARLGLGGAEGANTHGRGGGGGGAAAAAGRGAKLGGGGGGGGGAQASGERQEESLSWCCICSEDATLRCRECEAENGGGAGEGGQAEPEELFCARCFKEVHREDPDMKAHRPQALSGAGARGGGRSENGGGRKGWRGWR